MAHAHVSKVEDAEELNLTPIMNVVLVLIPLMLLNVVFMEISVIDVTMPQRSAGAAQNSGEPPKRLQLFISSQGFQIIKGTEILPAVPGCPAGGTTICVKDVGAKLEVNRYDWLKLYNELLKIKQEGEWGSHDTIEIVADSSVKFGTLVKVMDITRFQRGPSGVARGTTFNSMEEYEAAMPVVGEEVIDDKTVKTSLGLFPAVVLGLPTVTQ